MALFFGNNFNIDNAVTDFPLPDSPTIPNTSFFNKLKLILLTTLITLFFLIKLMLKFFIEIRLLEDALFKTKKLINYVVSFINIGVKVF